jgi:1-pyrroline-5-carboxylate dehydrogenase
MSAAIANPPTQLAPFANEPYTDFNQPDKAAAMRAAIAKVRSEFGKEYDLLIAGERRRSSAKLESLNPSKPSEVVGIHQKASEQDARDAVEKAYAYFPTWAEVSYEERAARLLRAAEVFRDRKYEFDAWLVLESGKTWAEAEADVSDPSIFASTTPARR